MANREQGYMAGFMAASRILTTAGSADRPTVRQEREVVVPSPRQLAQALENYLAIPTFIRKGRTIKL
ncbi:MAG: hypothetical protein OEL66_06020 [Desulfobulbaceae bacterium]|nr:hypothetical protein [Desulfobulbaceae bacterium]